MFTSTAQFNSGSMFNPSVSKEREKIRRDMKNLNLINSKDDLIKAYPDQFKGIGKFLGT